MCFIISSKKKLAEREKEIRKTYEKNKQIHIENALDYRMKASVENLNVYLEVDKSAVIKKVFINKQGVLSFVIMIPAGKDEYDFYVRSSDIWHCGLGMGSHPRLEAKILKKEKEIKILNIISGKYKRCGYGRALMEALFDIAEDNHINKIFGELSWVDEKDPYNENARNKFYEAMGFEVQDNLVVKELKAKESVC